MRHLKNTCKLNRTSSHRRCMFANMLKSLIQYGRIETTVPKAKALQRHADHMITLAKENTLASRRRAIAELMIQFNAMSEQEKRAARGGKVAGYHADREVINHLFGELGPRFTSRQGGYTRITKSGHRLGDNAQTCILEYLSE